MRPNTISDQIFLDSRNFNTKFARIKNLNSSKRGLPPVAESYTVPSSIHEEGVYRPNHRIPLSRGNNSSSKIREQEETMARNKLNHEGSYKSLLEEMRTNKSKSSLQTYLNETEMREELNPKNLIILVGEHKRVVYYDTLKSKWQS